MTFLLVTSYISYILYEIHMQKKKTVTNKASIRRWTLVRIWFKGQRIITINPGSPSNSLWYLQMCLLSFRSHCGYVRLKSISQPHKNLLTDTIYIYIYIYGACVCVSYLIGQTLFYLWSAQVFVWDAFLNSFHLELKRDLMGRVFTNVLRYQI